MNSKVINKVTEPERESFTELLGQLASSSAAMVHDEIELLIQRIREKVRTVRGAVFTIAFGAVLVLAACMSLCAAVIIALSSVMDPVMAALVTGSAFALVGIVIAFIGYKRLKKTIDRP